ncbi:glucohydrolase [Lactobacillus sp. CBA3606]|uniref:glycoside hydrolase family 13 protein n=1 Tax=Lactobacillus sp. CBA3606 TaxID=2099789 RepID=UPI000CFC5892|nr:alpha-glucosidase [Lactobacillus sp. CBA3606]AVK64205.1 glucohydrolase [Lactobacillus sp. CBA3606]
MVNWYDRQIIYQIYPKSFQDTNDDGIGDLQGVIQRIPYLKELGVTTIWLNPIYVSPQVDNGYDVSNYYAIEPSLGTMSDVEALIKALHQNNMHLLLDFVMNHTSDQHPWFQDAIKHPQGLYRDYYLWSDAPANQLPNNWGSFFGGSVWEADPGKTEQYYFHLFDRHMPDLNWRNPEVRHSMLEIAKFWVKKGIDGLRLDAFIHIDKANFKQQVPSQSTEPVVAEAFYAHLPHVQPYLSKFCGALRQLKPDIFILGEAASASPELLMDYSRPANNECNAVITFRSLVDDKSHLNPKLPAEFQPKPLDIEGMKRQLTTIQTKLAGVSLPVLYWSNHDLARLATRYASKWHHEQSLKCLAAMLYLQRGIPIIYYGEEVGMENLTLPNLQAFNDRTVGPFDRQAQALGYDQHQIMQMLNQTHKLAARGPMQWDKNQPYDGFSTQTPWLIGQTKPESSAMTASLLSFYRQLLKLKQTELFTAGDELIEASPKGLFQFTRQLDNRRATVTCNLTDTAITVAVPTLAKVQLLEGDVTQTATTTTYHPWSVIVTKN